VRALALAFVAVDRDGNLYAVDAEKGSVLWRYSTDGKVITSPLVKNGIVYFGSADSFFYALKARTGTDFDEEENKSIAK